MREYVPGDQEGKRHADFFKVKSDAKDKSYSEKNFIIFIFRFPCSVPLHILSEMEYKKAESTNKSASALDVTYAYFRRIWTCLRFSSTIIMRCINLRHAHRQTI